MTSTVHANDQTFDESVLQDKGTVLLDFWAPWCGPCRSMSDIVDEIAEEFGNAAKVVKVNIDESAEAAQKFNVTSIPTFVVIQNGEVKEQFSGAVPKQRLAQAIGRYIA